MRIDTANKFLKLIEEPTDKTVIIFVSQSADKLLPTILSRLQRVHVPRLSDSEAAHGISAKTGLSEELAQSFAHITDGNISAAIRMSSSGVETPDLELFSSWMRACWSRDGEAFMTGANDFASPGRESQKRFLTYALHMVRQCIIGNYGADNLVRLTKGEQAFVSKFSRFIHHKNVVDLSSLIEEAYTDISGNVNAKVVFFDLSVRVHMLLRKETQ
jgi:DNA polymerase-3 subunit delta'